MKAAATTPELVGRDAPLRELVAAYESANGGRGGLVLVQGEAGLGKTRLVDTFTAGLPTPVVRSACPDGVGAPAYWPWTQVVRSLLTSGGDSLDLLGAGRDDIERLVAVAPDDAPAPREDTATQFRFFDAVARLLAKVSRETTYVVVVEDAHWADPSSILLLEHVASTLATNRLLVIVTQREDESPPRLAALTRLAVTIRLRQLTGPQVGELVASVTGRPMTAENASALAQRTGGNPFFVHELVRLLDAEGREPEGTLPHSIRAVVERRLARIPQECHDLLGVASVLGDTVDVALLAAVASRREAEAVDQLDEAATSGLVRRTNGSVTVAHALIRETLYAALGAERRRALHQRAARELADRAADPAAVAHHSHLAATDHDSASAAIEDAVRAAHRAVAMLGYDEAADLYGRALQLVHLLPVGDQRHGRLVLARGDALTRAGHIPAARECYSAAAALARAAGDAELLGAAALGFSSGLGGFEVRLVDQPQIDLLEEALARLSPDDTLRPLLLARLSVALSLVDSSGRRLALAEESVAAARTTGDAVVLAQALAAHCDAIAGPAYSEQRLAEATEIVALAASSRDREQELLGRRLRFVALLELGDPAVWAEVDAFERLADTIRQPLYSWYVPLWRATSALVAGRYDDARALCDEAARIGALAHSVNAVMLTEVQKFVIAYDEGRVEEILSLMDDIYQPSGAIADILPERALALALSGRTDDAAAILDRGAPIGYWPNDDQETLPSLVSAAETAVRVGRYDHAETLLELLRPHAHRIAFEGIGAGVYGAVSRYTGLLCTLLGRAEEARAYLEDAIERNTRAALPLLAARARADLAALSSPPERDAARADDVTTGTIGREGDHWKLTWGGTTIRLRDAKGLHDLDVLLTRPGQAVHVLELVANVEGATVTPGADAPVLDRQALAAYRQRLRDIDDELDEAAAHHDTAREDRLVAERDFVTDELSSALGLAGRVRHSTGPAERARKAVAARIRDSIRRIGHQHAALGRHLDHAVRTGMFCTYEPEHPTRWLSVPAG